MILKILRYVHHRLANIEAFPLIISFSIGLACGYVCYHFRGMIFPGPGDFNMALDFANALLSGQDPYAFTPSNIRVGVPLPVAFFGMPLMMFTGRTAATIFFGISGFLLAYGILSKGEKWQLLIFTTFPFFYSLILAQWSPIITASWFIPIIAPLFVLIKPNIALPIAINRITKTGIILAAIIFLISLILYPTWPVRWLQMVGDFEYIIAITTFPVGPILLLSMICWYDPKARLLFGLSLVPIRAAYDLVPLWLIPSSKPQMILLVILSWVMPIINFPYAIQVGPNWMVLILYTPSLALVIFNNWPSILTSMNKTLSKI